MVYVVVIRLLDGSYVPWQFNSRQEKDAYEMALEGWGERVVVKVEVVPVVCVGVKFEVWEQVK